MHTFIQDLRFGVRMLLKSPGMTIVAVLRWRSGSARTRQSFSAVSAFLFRPLPVGEPAQLVRAFEVADDRGTSDDLSYPDFVDYRDQNNVFAGVVASPSSRLRSAPKTRTM